VIQVYKSAVPSDLFAGKLCCMNSIFQRRWS